MLRFSHKEQEGVFLSQNLVLVLYVPSSYSHEEAAPIQVESACVSGCMSMCVIMCIVYICVCCMRVYVLYARMCVVCT